MLREKEPAVKLREAVEQLALTTNSDQALVSQALRLMSNPKLRGAMNLSGPMMIAWIVNSHQDPHVCKRLAERDFYLKTRDNFTSLPPENQLLLEASPYIGARLRLERNIKATKAGILNLRSDRMKRHLKQFINKKPLDLAVSFIIAKDQSYFDLIRPKLTTKFFEADLTKAEIIKRKLTLAVKSPFFAAELFPNLKLEQILACSDWSLEQCIELITQVFVHPSEKPLRDALTRSCFLGCVGNKHPIQAIKRSYT